VCVCVCVCRLSRTLFSLFWSMFGLVAVDSVEIKYLAPAVMIMMMMMVMMVVVMMVVVDQVPEQGARQSLRTRISWRNSRH